MVSNVYASNKDEVDYCVVLKDIATVTILSRQVGIPKNAILNLLDEEDDMTDTNRIIISIIIDTAYLYPITTDIEYFANNIYKSCLEVIIKGESDDFI